MALTLGRRTVTQDIGQADDPTGLDAGLHELRERLRDESLRRERAEQELERYTDEMDTIFQIISHDLREPARTVSQFAKLLQGRVSNHLDEKSADFLERTKRGAERLHGQLNDLLILYRAQKEIDLSHPIDLNALAARTLEKMRSQVDAAAGRVELRGDLGHVRGSGIWLERALVHLIENACQHHFTKPDEGPRIMLSPWHGDPPRGEASRGFMVEDRGPGVNEDRKLPIFEVFRRSTTHRTLGSGAGLSIVRAVAERHGGWAWVTDREGGGSRFIVTLGGIFDAAQPRSG